MPIRHETKALGFLSNYRYMAWDAASICRWSGPEYHLNRHISGFESGEAVEKVQ